MGNKTTKRVSNFLGTSAMTRPLFALGAASVLFGAGPAHALDANTLPQNPNVVGGKDSFSQSGNTLNVNQQTNRTVIDWRSFDIGSKAQVNFAQPGTSSIAVNRVNSSANPTQIEGGLHANGQVWILNPNGVFFGKTAHVDAAGIVATTANIDDKAFMAGSNKLQFNGADHGSVENQGNISVGQAGLAAFVAPSVRNSGTINATVGRVALAAGTTYTLDLAGDHLVELGLGSVKAVVDNSGKIVNPGGTISLTAKAASQVVSSVVNVSGTVSASSVSNSGGTVVLGGDNVTTTSTAQISADAGKNGDGGTITSVASNQGTYAGSFSAKGGSQSGNGGKVETSGKSVTVADGISVDTRAPQGVMGNWTVDPLNVTITSGSGGGLTGSSITTGAIESALNTTDVTITTDQSGTDDGDLNLAGSINATGTGDLTLTGRHLYETSGSTISLAGALTLNVNAVNNTSNPSGNWISDALGMIGTVSGGSTINLGAGTYAAGTTISKADVTINGGHQAEIAVATGQTGLTINANDVTIENLEIAGPIGADYEDVNWSTAGSSTGIVVSGNTSTGPSGFNIAGNDVHDIRTGIIVQGQSSSGAITGNTVENTKGGILIQYNDGTPYTITGNQQGPVGNEWGIVLNLNTSGINTAGDAPTSAQQNILTLANANDGMATMDRHYAKSNRSQVTVDASSTATAADDGGYGNGLGNARQPLSTIQSGIDAVVAGGTVNVLDGTYTVSSGYISIGKSLNLIGESEAGVVIDAHGASSYGLRVIGGTDGVTLENFTLYGVTATGGYGIKAEDTTNLDIENVTSQGAYKAQFDLNGVRGGTLENVTANGSAGAFGGSGSTAGAAIAITDSQNITVANSTIIGGSYGGIGIYQSNKPSGYTYQAKNITIADSNTFDPNGATNYNYVYTEDESASNDFGTLNIQGFDYVAGLDSNPSDTFKFFQHTKTDAENYLDSKGAAALGYVEGWTGSAGDNNFSVDTVNGNAMSIQAAVNAAAAGASITVGDGTYTGDVTIAKSNLTLLSENGSGSTTIQGVAGTSALGTIYLTPGSNGTQIGDIDHGFHIVGFDNTNPGIEVSAVYVKGANSGSSIVGNEITAAGDEAILTEYGAAVSGLTIDSNLIDGQTFVGANPAGLGSSQQFTLWNVPRQAVVIQTGSSNTTFTNNTITTVTGGLNTSGQEQGNNLATIDSAGATITGNTFAGTTDAWYDALRARGTNTVISGNTFDGTNMGSGTNMLEVNSGTLSGSFSDLLANNTFENGAVWLDHAVGGVYYVFRGVNTAVNAASAGDTIDVAPGTYTESATNVDYTGGSGGEDFGLYVYKDGLTIQGVYANGTVITDPNDVQATITAAHQSNFSTQNWVSGADVTISGLAIDAMPGANYGKLLEVVGDGFTLKNSVLDLRNSGTEVALYMDDLNGTDTDVESFNVQNNVFYGFDQAYSGAFSGESSQIVMITNGVGLNTDASNRQFTGNQLIGGGTGNGATASNQFGLEFTGALPGVSWLSQDVGAVTVSGNTFSGLAAPVRLRGTTAEDLNTVLANNTFSDGSVMDYVGDTDQVRAGTYTFSWGSAGTQTVSEEKIFSTIQGAVDFNGLATGDTVSVGAGNYEEQVVITKSITLKGAGTDLTTISAPDLLADSFTADSKTYKAVISVLGGVNATITGLTVDGRGVGNANANLLGIGIYDSSATIDGVHVTRVRDGGEAGSLDGVQAGVGIEAYNDGLFQTVTVKNSTIDDFQKTAIVFAGKGITGNVLNNTITGAGSTGVTAQNGIEFYGNGGTITGTISGNTITGVSYSPVDNWSSTDIMLLNTSNVSVTGNTITGAGTSDYSNGIYVSGSSNALITGNTVTDFGWGVWVGDSFGTSSATVSNNIISGNGVAVGLGDSAHDASSMTVTGNSITGNDVAVELDSDSANTSFIGNWWGTSNDATIAGMMDGSSANLINFSTYLTTGTDTSTDAGFQGDFSNLTVTTLGAGSDRIAGAVSLVTDGGLINLLNGSYTLGGELDITKSLTLKGQSEAGTEITSNSTGYGINVTADNVSLQNFTYHGPTGTGSTYGIKVTPDTGAASDRLLNFDIENVTIDRGYRTGLDLNGVVGATIKNVTVSNIVHGNGIALTDSANVTITGSTTSNNAWGGLALYQTNSYYDQQLTGIVVDGTNTFNEANGVYAEDQSASQDMGSLTLAGYDYIVRSPNDPNDVYTFFQQGEQEAFDFATDASLNGGHVNLPTAYVEGWTGTGVDGNFYVGQGANSTNLLINAAVNAAAAGNTVNVEFGTYAEDVSVGKQLAFNFDDVQVNSFTLASAGAGSTLNGNLSANNAITLNGNATVNGDLGAGTFTSNGTLAMTGELSVLGAAALNGATSITGDVLADSLTSGNTLTVNGDVLVFGNVTLGGATSVTGDFDADALTANGAFALTGELNVLGAAALNGAANITGNVSASSLTTGSTLALVGNVEVDDGVTLGGASTIKGSIDATSLTANGTLQQTGNITTSGATALNGASNITGNIKAGSLSTGNTLAMAGNITATNGVTLGGASTVTGNVAAKTFTSNGTLALTGGLTTSGAALFNGASTVKGNVKAASITANSSFTQTGNDTASGAIALNGATSLAGNLTGGSIALGTTTLTGATALNTSAANGAIKVASVNGAQALSINAGSGAVSLGNVGATTGLASLSDSSKTTLTGSTYNAGSFLFGGDVTLTAATTSLSTGGGDITFNGDIFGTSNGAQSLNLSAGTGTGSAAANGDITLQNAGTSDVRLGDMTVKGDNFTALTVWLAGNYSSTLTGNQVYAADTLHAGGDVNSNVGGNASGHIEADGNVDINAGGDVSGTIGGNNVSLTGDDVNANVTAQNNATITGNTVEGSYTAGDTVGIVARQNVDAAVNATNFELVAASGSVDGTWTNYSITGSGIVYINGDPQIGVNPAQLVVEGFTLPAGTTIGANGQLILPQGVLLGLLSPGGGKPKMILVHTVQELGQLLADGYSVIVIDLSGKFKNKPIQLASN